MRDPKALERLDISEMIDILGKLDEGNMRTAMKNQKVREKLANWNLDSEKLFEILYGKSYLLDIIKDIIKAVNSGVKESFYIQILGLKKFEVIKNEKEYLTGRPELSQIEEKYSFWVSKVKEFIDAIEKLGESNISQESVSQLAEYQALKSIIEKSRN